MQFESLGTNGRVAHAVFTRQGGVSPAPFASLNLSVSVPDEKARVYANRRRAYGLYGRDTDTVVHAHLVHGREVARVTQTNNGTWIPRVDAIITNEPGCALTMNYADCTPIFLYDPVRHAIGLGHAGWQGAVRDLPGAMVEAMQREFGSKPADLVAAIGPCIGPCCYEVGEPVITAVYESFDAADSLFHPRDNWRMPAGDPATKNGRDNLSSRGLLTKKAPDAGGLPRPDRPHFDLPAANRHNLIQAGVHKIEMPGLCTACRTDLFFSHRAEKGRTGRFGTIFMLAATGGDISA